MCCKASLVPRACGPLPVCDPRWLVFAAATMASQGAATAARMRLYEPEDEAPTHGTSLVEDPIIKVPSTTSSGQAPPDQAHPTVVAATKPPTAPSAPSQSPAALAILSRALKASEAEKSSLQAQLAAVQAAQASREGAPSNRLGSQTGTAAELLLRRALASHQHALTLLNTCMAHMSGRPPADLPSGLGESASLANVPSPRLERAVSLLEAAVSGAAPVVHSLTQQPLRSAIASPTAGARASSAPSSQQAAPLRLWDTAPAPASPPTHAGVPAEGEAPNGEREKRVPGAVRHSKSPGARAQSGRDLSGTLRSTTSLGATGTLRREERARDDEDDADDIFSEILECPSPQERSGAPVEAAVEAPTSQAAASQSPVKVVRSTVASPSSALRKSTRRRTKLGASSLSRRLPASPASHL